jgi:branched-chain amino acid aminotransferase
MINSNDRLAYINGRILPETEATVSIRDMGLVYGDSVFDTARTFNGKIFMLEAHVDRLFESLEYTRIDPGMDKPAYIEVTNDLVERNLPMLRDGEDYWVTIRITSGHQALDGEQSLQTGPTIAIDCIPIPLRARASFFVNGIEAVIAERRRIAPEALSPNAKTNNYLNMILAQKQVLVERFDD